MKSIVAVLVLTCLFSIFGWAGIPKDVLLYLPFEDMDGGTVKDFSTYANKCTIKGNPKVVTGKIGQGIEFNGSTDFIEVADSPSLATLEDQITMAAWIYPNALGGVGDVINKWGANNDGNAIHLEVNADGTLRMCLRQTPAVKVVDFTTPDTLKAKKWTYLTGVFDGKEGRIYFDGKKVASANGAGKIEIERKVFEIGGNTIDSRYVNGILDEVAIWNRALSDDEITQAMNGKLISAAVAPRGKLTVTWGDIKEGY
ncbi:LamG domain-containing protein [Candidatus Poribacteria bacterium]|nr:LamG domain-containing protein [Candidatus Poribacteria bacterium]